MCKAVEDMIRENEIATAERVERKKAADIARELLKLEISDEKILKATKISPEELEKIKSE